MEFATRYRGAGADGEEQYARAVATADVPGCPVCLELPGVAYSVAEQGAFGVRGCVPRCARTGAARL